MIKIRDFIEQCQLTNAMIAYPKNSVVWAKIPGSYRRENSPSVDQVQILSSDSDSRTYEVSYYDQIFEIRFEDVVISQEQVSQIPIADSDLSYEIVPGNVEDIVSSALALEPTAKSEEIKNLISLISSYKTPMKLKLSSFETDRSVPCGDKFFVIEDV